MQPETWDPHAERDRRGQAQSRIYRANPSKITPNDDRPHDCIAGLDAAPHTHQRRTGLKLRKDIPPHAISVQNRRNNFRSLDILPCSSMRSTRFDSGVQADIRNDDLNSA
jgi:hypothetical protein